MNVNFASPLAVPENGHSEELLRGRASARTIT
jgi:hypothetical protein